MNEDTRRRVLQVAEELGYRRNELARSVVAGRLRMFGFLVPAPMLDFEVAARVLNGVLDEAEANGYSVQVMRLSGWNDDQIIERCVELRPAGVLGIYVSAEVLSHLRSEMVRFNIPIAVLDSTNPLKGASRILSDDIAGCRDAVAHLVSLGHRRIAFIGGLPQSVAGRLREEGYHRAMAEHCLPVLPGYNELGYWGHEEVRWATLRLFQDQADPPTAIFCADDKTAMTACRTLRSLGLSVPDDVSLVGFADLVMAVYNDPPLTTIAQPFREMGRSAVQRLLTAAKDTTPGNGEAVDPCFEEWLPTRLIVRQSTAPVKG